jgi:hypothetical protein
MPPELLPLDSPLILERMVRAVEAVRERMLRAAAALEKAGVPYAVIGGNAVAFWVARKDPEAVRNTRDVDVLLRRDDLEAARAALVPAGFIYHQTFGVHMFVDGPQGTATSAVHVLFAGEIVREGDQAPTPDLSEAERGAEFRVVGLEALVRMKLTSYRRKDQVHIQDMIGVGLLDPSWVARFPGELGQRLQHLFDTPDG